MSSFKIVAPENYSTCHQNYINEFIKLISFMSNNTDMIMGAKDVNSRHIISTNEYAKIVGLKKGYDVADRFDKEMPCDGTAQYAKQFVLEDQSIISKKNPSCAISTLNIHNYSDGTKARIFKKYILKHDESKSILGTIYSGTEIQLSDVLNIIPNYITLFGATGSIESINKSSILVENITLTNYEQEICFLLLLNWDFTQIANFMNEFRPSSTVRTSDTIIKKKNYICDKLKMKTTMKSDLVDYLVSINFHNKMPSSFYNLVIGSSKLNEISIST